MFDIAWTEMLVIAVVLIVVVGPKELPGMLRTFGKTVTRLRSMANDFRRQFDDALKEADLDDLKNLADDARKLNPAANIKKALNPLETAGNHVRSEIQSAFNPPKAEPPKPKPVQADDSVAAVTPAASKDVAPAATAQESSAPVAKEAAPKPTPASVVKARKAQEKVAASSTAKRVAKPATKPAAKTAAKSAIKAEAKPAARTKAKPAARPAAKPAAKSATPANKKTGGAEQ